MGAATSTSRQCRRAQPPRAPRRAQRRAGQRRDGAPRGPSDALGRGLGRGRRLEAVAGGQVDRLQHGVDGPADGGAVAALVPRRRVEVDARPWPGRGRRAARVVAPVAVARRTVGGRPTVRGPARPRSATVGVAFALSPGAVARVDRCGRRPASRRRGSSAASATALGTSARERLGAAPLAPSGAAVGLAGRPARRARPAPRRPARPASGGRCAAHRAVERDDEVIAGPRAGDVQQPAPLVLVELLVEGAGGLVVAGGERRRRAAARARRRSRARRRPAGRPGLGGEPGHDRRSGTRGPWRRGWS